MLEILRKAQKAYVVLIAVMLLLPVQQSFAQNINGFEIVGDSFAESMAMTHCQQLAVGSGLDLQLNSDQANNCCDDNSCDSSKCSTSASFTALLFNNDMLHPYDSQQHQFSVDQSETTVLPSELFRPPKKIQS